MTKENKKLHYQRKLRELSVLYEISMELDRSVDLKQVILPVLSSLHDVLGFERGTVTLLDRKTDNIQIEAAYGLTSEEQLRGTYRLGEGIIGTVVSSLKPYVVPRIGDEPNFLDRTGAGKRTKRNDMAYICVPVMTGNNPIGTLSVERPEVSDNSLEEDVKLLSIVGSMIAQAVKLRRKLKEEKQQLAEENARLQEQLKNRDRPQNFIGNSQAMQEVYDLVSQVAGSEATVLIRGESGTGKELVAQAIHSQSRRKDMTFIKVNCAALPETVIESELFGHEKGAFTSAIAKRKGRFELAHGGTIFLDEIGDLSVMTQAKLLRVLQEREFERVGGTETIKTNVRVIAATNRPLEKLMNSGAFREDLYYRLNVFPIHIPPLRDRRSDIILLADYFAEKYAKMNGKSIQRISTPAIELLMMYHWPGNVRELENCIERAVLLSTDEVIHGHHLPPSLQSAESTNTQLHTTLKGAMDEFERELIQDALKSSRGNMAKAARFLGITERIMGLRVKKFDIDSQHYHT